MPGLLRNRLDATSHNKSSLPLFIHLQSQDQYHESYDQYQSSGRHENYVSFLNLFEKSF